MKWRHHPETSSKYESWKFEVEQGENVPYPREDSTVLYLIDFHDGKGWSIVPPHRNGAIGHLPLDMPQEQLLAAATALWRLS